MLIPLIPKNPEASGFDCRDGEIELSLNFDEITDASQNPDSTECSSSAGCAALARNIGFTLTEERQYPAFNVRIALRQGEKEKAALMLNGEISRVDPETSDRITQAIAEKTAEEFFQILSDLRRDGLFILPFRAFCRLTSPDGQVFPSPQALILPSPLPPHPEIIAASATEDSLNLALRIPVKPQRLAWQLPAGTDENQIELFASYSIFLPDPKEIRASIGSVAGAAGSHTTGVRFAFLSLSAMKSSVAAPEKYYQLFGNSKTGYRFSSKTTTLPDYSVYAEAMGTLIPFPIETLIAKTLPNPSDADPLDWIADWRRSGNGVLPARPVVVSNGISVGVADLPDGLLPEQLRQMAEKLNMPNVVLTRPMALGISQARRNASLSDIRRCEIHGLSDGAHLALLFGTDDGSHYTLMRAWNPALYASILAPRRRWMRLLLLSEKASKELCLEVD